jgi:hypothetical protein
MLSILLMIVIKEKRSTIIIEKNEVKLDGFKELQIGLRSDSVLKLKNRNKTGKLIATVMEKMILELKGGKPDAYGMMMITLNNMSTSFRKDFILATSSHQEDDLLLLVKHAIIAAREMKNNDLLVTLLSLVVGTKLMNKLPFSNDIMVEYDVPKTAVDQAVVLATTRFPGMIVNMESRNRNTQINDDRVAATISVLQLLTTSAAADFKSRNKGIKFNMTKKMANMLTGYKSIIEECFPLIKPVSSSLMRELLNSKEFAPPQSYECYCTQCKDGEEGIPEYCDLINKAFRELVSLITDKRKKDDYITFLDDIKRYGDIKCIVFMNVYKCLTNIIQFKLILWCTARTRRT